MTLYRGTNMLLSVSDGGGGYHLVGGLRVRRAAFNSAVGDATSADSQGWRELLPCGGLRQASITGRGLFVDDEAADRVRTLFFGGAQSPWSLTMPSVGELSGSFQIAGFEYSGDTRGEIAFSLTLLSAGILTFTELGG